MTTFTSTLPDSLLEQLNSYSKKLKMPKNKLIQRALVLYLEQLERAEYIHSFRKYKEDVDILNIAEEGIEDYYKQLDLLDNITN
jgi:uncharacterized protein (DUF924 family)